MIRVHYDGKVLVPEEPADLPIGETLEALIGRPAHDELPDALRVADRLRRLDAAAGRVSAPAPSAESLRRESLYEERI